MVGEQAGDKNGTAIFLVKNGGQKKVPYDYIGVSNGIFMKIWSRKVPFRLKNIYIFYTLTYHYHSFLMVSLQKKKNCIRENFSWFQKLGNR